MQIKKCLPVLLLSFVLVFSCSSVYSFPDSRVPQHWYERAQVDFEDAELVYNHTSHFGQVCFLAHQAIEKALKGAIISQGKSPDRTHFTYELAKPLGNEYPELKKISSQLRWIDSIYVPSRYPKGIVYSKEQASKALKISARVLSILFSSKLIEMEGSSKG